MKILQISPTMGHGGISMMMKMYAEELIKYDVVFDFLHHGKDEKFHDELKRLGSKFFSLSPIGSIGYKNYFKQFKQIIDENGPYDAIHINMNYQSGKYAKMAKHCGIKNRIIHVHGLNFYKEYLRIFMPLFRCEIKKYGTCFCADSSQCGDYYFNKKRYSVVPVAIDTTPYEKAFLAREKFRATYNISENDIAIGHIAAFYPVKNHSFDVKLLKYLVDNNPSKKYKIIFAGNGPLKEEIKLSFQQNGLAENVLFLGNIDCIPEYLSAMDVTILPSISEGLGQVLIQSQAMGTPCVASDTLPRESDMHMGLANYISTTDLNALEKWAKAINSAIGEKPSYDICKKGIDDAGYSIEVAAKKLYNIYLRNDNF